MDLKYLIIPPRSSSRFLVLPKTQKEYGMGWNGYYAFVDGKGETAGMMITVCLGPKLNVPNAANASDLKNTRNTIALTMLIRFLNSHRMDILTIIISQCPGSTGGKTTLKIS